MSTVPHRPSFVPVPLALLAASFAAGVLIARLGAPALSLCLACAAAATLASCFLLIKQKLGLATVSVVGAYLLAGAVVVATAERAGAAGGKLRRLYDEGRIESGAPVEITGALKRAPERAPDGFYLTLRVDALRFKSEEHAARGVVELFAPVRDPATDAEYDALNLRRGSRLRVMAALSRERGYRNPGVTSFTEYLDGRSLDAAATIKSPLLVEKLGDELVFAPLLWLDGWRGRLLARVNELFSPETAGVINAATLGNRYGLARATAERFRAGGTFHVLVISGLHITLIGALVWAAARRVTKRRAWQWAVSVAVTWAFAVAVGAEASVVRAALMFTVVAFAPVAHRRASTINALGGAALALLVWRPGELFGASFQLTFLSVLAIVALAWPLLSKLEEVGEWRPTQGSPYPPLCPRPWKTLGEALYWSEQGWRKEMERNSYRCRLFKTPLAVRLERLLLQRPLRYVFVAVIVSACVQVVLLPLSIIYFHRLSLASVLLNVVVGALMALLSISALLTLVIAQANGGSPPAALLWLTEQTNWLMTHSVDPFADLGVAEWRLPEYSGWAGVMYVLYFIPLALIVGWLARWRPVKLPFETARDAGHETPGGFKLESALLTFAILFVIVVAHPFSAGRPDGKLRVDFLDVGQGDAALVTMPDGVTLLVDGGGRPRFDKRPREGGEDEENAEPFERDARSVGDSVVSEYLWWRGLSRVDYVLATHADADHMEGLNDVVNNFVVRAAFVGRASTADAGYRRFSETLTRRFVPVSVLHRGDTLRVGRVTIEVLWPPPADNGAADAPSANDDSLVLRLRFGEKSILLTGDIERSAEAALIAAGGDLRSDIVKVAHHGSRTSSTPGFVSATRPTWAVISVGTDSPYGHPEAKVIERWRAVGAHVLTTGEGGTVTIVTDGDSLTVATYVDD